MRKLTVIGGGKMGEAIAAGLIAARWAEPVDLTMVEPVEARRVELSAAYPGVVVQASADAAGDVLIAVKPDHVEGVCGALSPLAPTRVVSIAAGVTIGSLESWLPEGTRVIRVMPNTPAMVGAGMSALAGGAEATTVDLEWATQILSAVGETVVLEEPLLDAVTGLSGSGPAYVFLLAEALIDAGVAVGLDADTSALLTRQTLLGAARLLSESGESAARLRENVTSPNGTTAEGLRVFEERDFRGIVTDVVAAATRRSRELGA
jgi:pyrroline-5-carboxylate reductase